jgi:hypothetical protein
MGSFVGDLMGSTFDWRSARAADAVSGTTLPSAMLIYRFDPQTHRHPKGADATPRTPSYNSSWQKCGKDYPCGMIGGNKTRS